jgi:hypothetical protein
VNTTEPYEGRIDRAVAEPRPPTDAAEVAALAVHQDPSLAADPTPYVPPDEGAHPSILWLRPSELVTTVGTAQLGEAVDVQADVVRRARRAPLTAASRLRGRISRSAIARTEPAVRTSTSRSEGVQL